MKKMLLSLVITLIGSPVVFADGMFHVYDKDMWGLHPENRQLAAINYQNGFENLLICIDVNDQMHSDKAVWIFPVPAKPDRVVIDVLKGFPAFRGNDIDREYRDAVATVGTTCAIYSTFPLGIVFSAPFMTMRARIGAGLAVEDTVVYKRVEKMGLTTELITTKDQKSLSQYLQSKQLNLPSDSKTILNEYLGKEYSFVISYVSNLGLFKLESQKTDLDYHGYRDSHNGKGIPIGVFVRFPTEKIYFPLKPTSVYGNREIPVVLYVIGHVTPDLYGEIKSQSEITYYAGRSFYHVLYSNNNSADDDQKELSPFFNGQTDGGDFKYTKIKITAPSSKFIQDLWIHNYAPILLEIKELLTISYLIWGILLYVGLSVVASVLAGKIAFLPEPLPTKKLLLHGLWNCSTLFGFTIATIQMKTRELDQSLLDILAQKGLKVRVKDPRKKTYVYAFYIIFLLLVGASVLLLRAIP